MKRRMFVLTFAAILGPGACWAADPTFTFGFEGFPTRIEGAVGTEVTFEGDLTLTSADIPVVADTTAQEGVQGWSYGLKVDGATIDSAATFDPITPGWEDLGWTAPDTKGLDLSVATYRTGNPANLTLWKAGYSIPCIDAADANEDSMVNLADAMYLIQYLFQSGPAPTLPFPGCGTSASMTGESCPYGSTICP